MQTLIDLIAGIFVLTLPGLAVSFAFINHREVDLLERITMAVTFSIAIVPLLTFYLNLLGVPLRRETIVLESVAIIIISYIIYILKNKWKTKK